MLAPSVSAERGYLREAGNLLFHVSVLVVMAGLRGRQPPRLPGRHDRGRRQRHVQQPHAVRRLQPRQPVRGGGPRRLLPRHRGLRRGVDDLRPGAGPGAQVRVARELRRGRRGAAAVRPAGQPPADDRRHRRLPDRPRLCPGHHDPRRKRRRRQERSRHLPARGRVVPLDRRREGARRPAAADRARGLVLPDVRLHRGDRAVLGVRRREEPRDLDAGLRRRPRHGHRRTPVGVPARQDGHRAAGEPGRLDVPGRPRAR